MQWSGARRIECVATGPSARRDSEEELSEPQPFDRELGVVFQIKWGFVDKEVVFYHSTSRSLIVGDLAFNLRPEELWTRLSAWIEDAHDGFGPARVLKMRLEDHEAARRSIERMLEWDFQRIVLPHGERVETNARSQLEDAFAWL